VPVLSSTGMSSRCVVLTSICRHGAVTSLNLPHRKGRGLGVP
jgi:hypothetical protein